MPDRSTSAGPVGDRISAGHGDRGLHRIFERGRMGDRLFGCGDGASAIGIETDGP